MSTVVAVIVGVVVGFVIGWLVRDASSRPLIAPGEEFGLGVPSRFDEPR